MTVKVRNYINGELKSEEIISNKPVEYYFVVNALFHISKNKLDNSFIEAYKDYVKSIALYVDVNEFNGVIKTLCVWLEKNISENSLNHIFINSHNKSEFCVI